MNNHFHEFRYILHLKDYDDGVFFYREVLGLQPNYNWAIVPDNRGYRFYMGTGRPEIVQYPFPHRQGTGEFSAECRDVPLCLERILEECPDVELLKETAAEVSLKDSNGNLIHIVQQEGDCRASGPIEKENMFTGRFTGILYEKDLQAAVDFYCGWIGLECLSGGPETGSCLLQAGDALLELRQADTAFTGPAMIALEADSVNQIHDRMEGDSRLRMATVLHDTDFDARRLFRILDPSDNVVEFYAYLRNVREELLLH